MDRHSEDDATLVRRCLAGDAAAWQGLVEAHRRGLIALARRILPQQDAEDVVDAMIADLWERKRLVAYAGRSSLRTWLGAVAVNTALNARRAAASRAALAAAVPAKTQTDHDPSPDQLHAVLREAIASLQTRAKALVLLYYEQELSLDEIGRLLGRSKSTLSRELKRVRDHVRMEADRLANERYGSSLAALRAGVNLDQLDLDLRSACAQAGNNVNRGVSNIRPAS